MAGVRSRRWLGRLLFAHSEGPYSLAPLPAPLPRLVYSALKKKPVTQVPEAAANQPPNSFSQFPSNGSAFPRNELRGAETALRRVLSGRARPRPPHANNNMSNPT